MQASSGMGLPQTVMAITNRGRVTMFDKANGVVCLIGRIFSIFLA
jgi:hypothetical protein